MPAREPHDEGAEPDYRFTLANERTFLAWIRTALGLLAGGVAVHQLLPRNTVTTDILATLCVLLSAVLAVTSYPRLRRVQAAMRRDEPLPGTLMPLVLTGGIFVITVVSVVLVLTG